MFRVLVATDSRGTGLLNKIMDRLQEVAIKAGKIQDIHVEMLAKSGTTVETLLPWVEGELDANNYHLIIAAIGINNLTNVNSDSTITPIFQEVSNLVDVMTTKYQAFKNTIAARVQAPPVVIAQLIGVRVMRYNEAHGKSIGDKPLYLNPYPLQQHVINEGVRHLNLVIVNMNEESGVIGPWWQSTIHHLKGANRYDRYKKLWDGLHPDSDTKKTWGCMIANSILANRRKMEE